MPKRRVKIARIFLICLPICISAQAAADDIPPINENGQVGGLHLPTARTLAPGTVYTGFGIGDFNEYGYAGLQPFEDLRLTIRNTKDSYGFTFPGLDAQIQLLDESDWFPETAVGFTHMIGQGRYAGEYLAFSKAYEAFDFGLGVGWGRYANNGVFENPIHTPNAARDSGVGSDGLTNWFSGRRLGLFGNVTYQTPWRRLQLVAEFDRDPYLQERFESQIEGKDQVIRRAPVNVGAHVTLMPGLALSASMDSLSQPQLYITYALNLEKDNPDIWGMGMGVQLHPAPIPDDRHTYMNIQQVQELAWRDGVALEKLSAPQQDMMQAHYAAGDTPPYAADLGHAAYDIADNSGADVVAITLVPEHDGLVGDTYTVLRREVVRDTEFKGSAAEVRQSATITPTAIDNTPDINLPDHPIWRLYTAERFDLDPYEPTSFLLPRKQLQLGGTVELLNGITLGATGNYNISDDYPYIPPTPHPVRSDVGLYLGRDENLENLYVNAMQTIAPGLHTRVTAGLLEEMYRGTSGEVLYQPFQARWAVGVEGDWLQQRAPEDDFAKLNYVTTPAVLSFYYEILPRSLTVIARVQQFLAEDKGGTLEFEHQFFRGAKLGFAVDYSNARDYGGIENYGHWAARISLNIPMEYAFFGVPMENHLDTYLGPTLRDSGQMVELPVRLWDATRPISYGPIENSWGDFLNF